jgi:altronate dehydratase
MVQNTSRASPGNLSGGRSTIAEKSQRSRGSIGVVVMEWALLLRSAA